MIKERSGSTARNDGIRARLRPKPNPHPASRVLGSIIWAGVDLVTSSSVVCSSHSLSLRLAPLCTQSPFRWQTPHAPGISRLLESPSHLKPHFMSHEAP